VHTAVLDGDRNEGGRPQIRICNPWTLACTEGEAMPSNEKSSGNRPELFRNPTGRRTQSAL
jgi:hypothetical protein